MEFLCSYVVNPFFPSFSCIWSSLQFFAKEIWHASCEFFLLLRMILFVAFPKGVMDQNGQAKILELQQFGIDELCHWQELCGMASLPLRWSEQQHQLGLLVSGRTVCVPVNSCTLIQGGTLPSLVFVSTTSAIIQGPELLSNLLSLAARLVVWSFLGFEARICKGEGSFEH